MSETNDNSLIAHDDGDVTLSKARKLAALNAAWEVRAIAKHLGTLGGDNTEGTDLVRRGLHARLEVLADVVCAAIDLPFRTTAELLEKVGKATTD
jgi:hypothetical protein